MLGKCHSWSEEQCLYVLMPSGSFSFLLFPLSSTLPSAMTTNSGRGNVEQGSSHLRRYYLRVFASRCETGNYVFFFFKVQDINEETGRFHMKAAF